MTESLWNLVTPHGQTLEFTSVAPTLRWHWTPADVAGSLAPALLTWNTVLYLTVWSFVPSLPRSDRLRWLCVATPTLALWHVADLLLTVESRLLTLTRPEGYDLSAGFDLWFLWVKFANNLNVLGLRQVVPLLLIAAQWLHWRRVRNEDAPTAV